jgi:hypothetical protein
MKKISYIFILLTIYIALSLILFNKKNKLKIIKVGQIINKKKIKKIKYFIFVHGSYGIRELIKLRNLFQIPSIINKINNNSFIISKNRWTIPIEKIKYLMGTQLGIFDLKKENVCLSDGAKKIFSLIECGIEKTEDSQKCKKKYFIFNWSGNLNNNDRNEAAENLFSEINKIKKNDSSIGVKQEFYLIGYSHGGNVCTKISKIAKEKKFELINDIKYLLIIGTPIYSETEENINLINNENKYFFKNVINIYSNEDYIQLLDMILFEHRKNRTIKKKRKNLFQFDVSYEIKYNFNKNFFLSNNKKYESISSKIISLIDKIFYCPGHAELVYYAVPKKEIRPPFIIFLPFFIDFCNKNKKNIQNNSLFASFYCCNNNLVLYNKSLNSVFVYHLINLYSKYKDETLKILRILNEN